MAVRFINVDLDIKSKRPLEQLCLELDASDVYHLHCGPSERGFFARFECADGGEACEPDNIINRFCEALESLHEKGKAEWETADHRCFDLGYEVSGSNISWNSSLRHSTLSRVVALGASLAFTVYPRTGSQ